MTHMRTLLGAAVFSLMAAGCSSSGPDASASGDNAGLKGSDVPVAEACVKADVKAGFVKGADLSALAEMEKAGFKYFDENGVQKDAMTILKEEGFNAVRLRLWVNPYSADGQAYGGGTNDLKTDIELARRAKALGMQLLLDLHYSDFWTDPGKQIKPKGWEQLTFKDLCSTMQVYTQDTIEAFKEAGVMPDMVQVGNEITSGMLWPDGKSWGGDGHEFDRLSELLKAGIAGVKAVAGADNVQIMLHLDKGTKQEQYKWWFDEISRRNVPYDVIGMSFYTWWDGSIEDLSNNMAFVQERYGKPVMIAEVAYGYTFDNDDAVPNTFTPAEARTSGYAGSVSGQALFMKDVMEAVSAQPQGLGIYYWEPAWKSAPGITWATPAGIKYINDSYEVQGNARENQALFDKDGRVLPSVKVFNN